MVADHPCRSVALPALLCLLSVACVYSPKPQPPQPLNEPVDAFEAVGAPQRSGATNAEQSRDTLSTDIERLQNARRTYEHEQVRLRAQALRRQAECRADPDSQDVPIEDGSDHPAVYCQSTPGADGKSKTNGGNAQ